MIQPRPEVPHRRASVMALVDHHCDRAGSISASSSGVPAQAGCSASLRVPGTDSRGTGSSDAFSCEQALPDNANHKASVAARKVPLHG